MYASNSIIDAFEKASPGERIIGAVIGESYKKQRWHEDGYFKRPAYMNAELTWKAAKDILRAEYDDSLSGTPYEDTCPPVYAWTSTKVLFIRQIGLEYRVNAVPRNPGRCKPVYAGRYLDEDDIPDEGALPSNHLNR